MAGITRDRRRGERRSEDRRDALRRAEDRRAYARKSLALLIALCGALAALYLFIGAIGAVDFGQAVAASIGAFILAAVWFAGFMYRLRTGAVRAQRPDRERRGF
jgi:hypothetical protein